MHILCFYFVWQTYQIMHCSINYYFSDRPSDSCRCITQFKSNCHGKPTCRPFNLIWVWDYGNSMKLNLLHSVMICNSGQYLGRTRNVIVKKMMVADFSSKLNESRLIVETSESPKTDLNICKNKITANNWLISISNILGNIWATLEIKS